MVLATLIYLVHFILGLRLFYFGASELLNWNEINAKTSIYGVWRCWEVSLKIQSLELFYFI